jgi:flagellar biosynthesis protein FlhF
MFVQRFLRPTVREAAAAARQALGPDALVLSTELVPAPGWRGWAGGRLVALTAAADRPVSPARSAVAASRQTTPGTTRASVAIQLVERGLDPQLADATVRRLSRSELRSASTEVLREALAAELALFAAPDLGEEPEPAVEVFLGPTGSGKTTTIAKIAAQERAAGRTPRALIAADGERVGAIAQLRTYAAIIGSPFRIADGAADLRDALDQARRPVLVDTAGRLPTDPALHELLTVLRDRPGVVTHLVLPADTSLEAARRLLDRYAFTRPQRVVITKLDETRSAAPLFGALRDRALPVSYVASGHNVPEDLMRATPAVLAAALLGDLPEEAVTCH